MMNQQNNNLTSADNAERFELADLQIADEQADAVCGGAEQIDRPRPPGGTGFVNNHNETASQDEEGCAAFTELSLTDEELDGIKGGAALPRRQRAWLGQSGWRVADVESQRNPGRRQDLRTVVR